MSWGTQGNISSHAWLYNSSFLLQDLSILILQFSQQWHALFSSSLVGKIKGIIFSSRWQDWKRNLNTCLHGLMCKLHFFFPYSCDDLSCLGIFGFSEYCNNGQILLQSNFLFKSCILTELSCFLFTSCEGKWEGKRSGEIPRGTNLTSDCRGKSVKESELKDIDDLQSSVPTREYSCHKMEEKAGKKKKILH